MSIYRGSGGAPSATDAITLNVLIQLEADAEASATAAAASASAASTSATAAQAAETNAETAQAASETAQANAELAETNAETAQAAAEAAQTNAETAQTAAETAQTGAETAQTATEAVYDNFDDRYLGDKASDPTLDNDGDALLDGALYWNTTIPQMRVYDLGTTSWLPATNIDKATQAQAEAGTDDTAYMTSLKTEQAIEANAVDQDSDTGAANLPSGTTAQRPSTPAVGMFRHNADNNQFEGYNNGEWSGIGGARGGAGNPFVYENDINVTADYTITSGKNAMSAGPITINTGFTVTVPSGSVWTIV